MSSNNNASTTTKTIDYHRVFEICLTKLVLEVFAGSGGAIWGFSEVTRYRHPSTQELWRCNAQIVGIVLFLRFLLQMMDLLSVQSRRRHNITYYSPIHLIQISIARIVLEVFGAAGAIWGFSETVTLRRVAETNNNEFYRWMAAVVGIIFMVRFLLQMLEFVRIMMNNNTKNIINDDDNTTEVEPCWKQFYQIFATKLVLEVFGSTGAIWGFSEVLTLRTSSTQELWRICALFVGSLFFLRYGLQMKEYIIQISFGSSKNSSLLSEIRKQEEEYLNGTIDDLEFLASLIVLENGRQATTTTTTEIRNNDTMDDETTPFAMTEEGGTYT